MNEQQQPPLIPACPYCGERLILVRTTCRNCLTDLARVLAVAELPDYHFNLGLEAAGRRSWLDAVEHLGATIALRPNDVDALVLLGKVRYQIGGAAAALGTWRRANELAPERADVSELVTSATRALLGSPRSVKPSKSNRSSAKSRQALR